MITKALKYGIVLALAITFFSGTAMAHGGDRHRAKQHRGYHKVDRYHSGPKYKRHNYDRHQARKHHGHRKHWARDRHDRHDRHYRKAPRRTHVEKRHPLAPRILWLGPVPVPVPPLPHEIF